MIVTVLTYACKILKQVYMPKGICVIITWRAGPELNFTITIILPSLVLRFFFVFSFTHMYACIQHESSLLGLRVQNTRGVNCVLSSIAKFLKTTDMPVRTGRS